MRPRLRSLRRQLEIAVLRLLAVVLRRPRALAIAALVVVVPCLAAGAVIVQRGSGDARPAAVRAATAPDVEPAPPAPLDPALFAAAAKRPSAAPALRRLPGVDLNGLSAMGIPRVALRAYGSAAATADREDSSCHLRWWLLAGIGLVESGHAHSGGSALPRWNGVARPPILGPRLDGTHGYAAIRDTDRGLLDRDKAWDRAVGPMQFLPQTWQVWGGAVRGRGGDPQDIRLAALAAARYLCAGSADLSQPQGLATAVYSYNHSFDYVRLVLSVGARYAGIDATTLGVDLLPHDQPSNQAAPQTSASPRPSATPTTSPSPGTGAAVSPSPSPGGGTSASPSASPSSSTTPSLPPVPTPLGTPAVIHS